MNPLKRLAELFSEFPGIGPRHARRMVYFLLGREPRFLVDLAEIIGNLKTGVTICTSCFRFFEKDRGESPLCSICRDASRDQTLLLVVSYDADLETMEKTGIYNGLYFVLGGTIPLLDKSPENRIRERELLSLINERAKAGELKEIIFAMNATPEGENTYSYLEDKMKLLQDKHKIKITLLGRGLSTGSELEYSDKETLKNALKNRQ